MNNREVEMDRAGFPSFRSVAVRRHLPSKHPREKGLLPAVQQCRDVQARREAARHTQSRAERNEQTHACFVIILLPLPIYSPGPNPRDGTTHPQVSFSRVH